jgi:hypothetical protein
MVGRSRSGPTLDRRVCHVYLGQDVLADDLVARRTKLSRSDATRKIRSVLTIVNGKIVHEERGK